MTRARRRAGARRPAPSTSAGSRRPDARSGRARARRLSLLLPVLALLVGALSLFAAGTAEAQGPAAPTALSVENGDRRLTLTWTAPTGTLTEYHVHYTSAPASGSGAVSNSASGAPDNDASTHWKAVTRSGTTASQTITGLAIGTAYRVRVRARSSGGNGAWVFGSGTPTKPVITFAMATGTDHEDEHSWLININAAPPLATASSVNVRVDPASTASSDEYTLQDANTATPLIADEGSPATTISVDLDSSDTVNEPHKTIVLNLEAITNAPYTLGTQKTYTLTITDNDPPAAPTGLSVIGEGEASLMASWTKPAGPVTAYDPRYKEASAPDQAATTPTDPSTGWVSWAMTGDTTATTTQISGLTKGTVYHVQVRANDGQTQTGNGWGPYSATQTGTAGVDSRSPGALRNLRAFPGASGTLIIRAENPAYSRGGTLLGTGWSTGSDIHYTSAAKSAVGDGAPASGTDPTTAWVASDTRRALITGLTNNTEYRVRARKHNRFGPGKWAHTTGTPQGQLDTTAPGVRLLRPWALHQLQLVWGDPVPGLAGLDHHGYQVHYTSAAESAAANDAAAISGTDPSGGWVDAKRTGSHVSRLDGGGNIFSFPAGHEFKRGTEYRFRVRASYAQYTAGGLRAANGYSNWGHTKFVVGAQTAVGLYEPEGAAGYESLGYASVRVRLAAPAAGAVTVDYATAADTGATSQATAGSDYTAVSGTLTFAAGETAKTVRVPIINDSNEDSGERFLVTLSNPQPSDKVRLGSFVPGFSNTEDLGVLTATAKVWIFNHEADLKALAVEGAAAEDGPYAALDIGAFAAETTAYAVTVPHGTTHARLKPTALHEKQKLKAGTGSDLQAVASGVASGVIALAVGDNALVVESWIPSGERKTYRVTVTREAAQQQPEAQQQQQPSAGTLTAAFENVPSEHDGTAFTFDLTLSEAPGAGNLPVAASFKVAPGTASVSGSGTRYTVTVTPKPANAWKDVKITLAGGRACGEAGAICTADGRALSNSASATVGGPVRIRVEGARAKEGKDESLDFAVTLNRAAGHEVSVDYATEDGTAAAGADYTATSGTLTFAAGETAKTVSVPVLDDAIDEGKETMRLLLSNPKGAYLRGVHSKAKGVIRNEDPLQAMWLARFGRMVASDAVGAVTARLETPRDAGSHVTFAGQRVNFGEAEGGGGAALATVLTGLAQTFGAPSAPASDDDPGSGAGAGSFARHGLTDPWNDSTAATGARRVTGRELLLGSSFRAVLGQGAGSQWTSWGQGASVSRFSAAVPGLDLSGESATGSMGMDYERGRLLMGFAMTHSVGEGTATDEGWRYELGSTATTMLPYARLALTDRVSAWGLAGTGSGTLSLDLDGRVAQRYRTDLSMTLAAAGVRGDLVKPAEAGGFALALKADAFWVRTESDRVATSRFGSLSAARGEASRVRAVLDGSRTFSLASGAALTPKLELGLRRDGGDAETGTGVEFGGGLGYADPSWGLDMALKVHGLAVHSQDGYDEWGVSGQLRLVPGGSGRGLSASLTPSWGVDPSGSERLWAEPASSGLAATGEAEPSSRLDGEVGYGMALWGDRFTGTPNVGFGMSEAAREYRMGWRLTSADPSDPGFEIGLDATRREAANDNEAEHGVMLKSLMRW